MVLTGYPLPIPVYHQHLDSLLIYHIQDLLWPAANIKNLLKSIKYLKYITLRHNCHKPTIAFKDN